MAFAHPAQAAAPAAAIRGKAVFQTRCIGCHSLDRDDEGPRLKNVYGRSSGTVPGFPYSDALKLAHIVWNDKSLEKWLAEPDILVPGSGMPVYVTDAQERRDVIEYLKAISKK
jgi:cytochrome c